MRVISLGWGVQSFTIAAMAALGDIEPVDVALHADTGFESKLTYAFAERWTSWLEDRGVKVATVQGTSGRLDDLFVENSKRGTRFLRVPAFIKFPDGTKGMTARQCTSNWKIKPMRQWLQANRNSEQVTQLIGISVDEARRMRKSDVKYITHEYPLIEARMARRDCIIYLESHGVEVPPKSACVFCPFHSLSAWCVTKSVPDDWDLTVKVDELIRYYDEPNIHYLTNKCLPITELDLSTMQDHGQLNIFESESEA